MHMCRSNLSILKCLISPDPYALWVPEASHFSRFVESFLLELFILSNIATKNLPVIPLQGNK